jgi:transposase-like protein
LDEVFLTINGECHYLWRAVDQDENVLDILVQSRRNKKAAKKFFRKLLKGLQYVPRVIITDKLKSYGAAKREILPGVEHRQSRYLNNRCETPIGPRSSASGACKGSSQRDMLSTFCLRMAPLPSTSHRDGICYPRRRTAKRCTTVSRVGPKSQVRSGRPKRRAGGNRIRNVPAVAR